MSLSRRASRETRGSCLSAAIDCNARAAWVAEKSPESSALATDPEIGLWRARDIRRERLWLKRNTPRGQTGAESNVRVKFLPCSLHAVHNDAEAFRSGRNI